MCGVERTSASLSLARALMTTPNAGMVRPVPSRFSEPGMPGPRIPRARPFSVEGSGRRIVFRGFRPPYSSELPADVASPWSAAWKLNPRVSERWMDRSMTTASMKTCLRGRSSLSTTARSEA